MLCVYVTLYYSALNVRNEEPQTRLSPQRGEANSRVSFQTREAQ